MTLGEFLGQAVHWLYDFWPLRIVREWEQGVRLYAGRVTTVLDSKNGIRGTGLHGFWPRIGEIRIHECNWEVVETGPQTVETKTGVAVTAQFAVTYRIVDLKGYYVSIQSQDQTILAAVRAAAGALVPQLDMNELQSTAFPDALLAAVKKRVRGWGLEVKDVMPTTLVAAQALRLLMDSPPRESTGGHTEME